MKKETLNKQSILERVSKALDEGQDIYSVTPELQIEKSNPNETILGRNLVRPMIVISKDKEEGDVVLPLTSSAYDNEYKKVKLNPDDVSDKNLTSKRDSYVMGKFETMDNNDRKKKGTVKSESILKGFFGNLLKKLS